MRMTQQFLLLLIPGFKTYPVVNRYCKCVTNQRPAYNWQVTNFTRPDKRSLIIYELLLRDFLAAHDWKTFMDTLSYLKNLGVNAIEIMPFNEFEGNDQLGL